MRFDSTVAPVPRIDTVFGALVTLAATAFVAFVALLLVAPDATTAGGVLPVAVAVVVGASTTAWLLLDGYDRLHVPVEGRRWTVELVAFGALFAAAQGLIDVASVLPDWVLVVAALVALYASSLLGRALATARDWYDRDAYYRER